MANSMSFTIKVNPLYLAKLESSCKRALEICGGKAETYAKDECPVDTGWLRDHISHKADDKVMQVGTNVEYAPYVELGHHTVKGRFIKPNPFIGRALENHIDEYKNVILTELNGI